MRPTNCDANLNQSRIRRTAVEKPRKKFLGHTRSYEPNPVLVFYSKCSRQSPPRGDQNLIFLGKNYSPQSCPVLWKKVVKEVSDKKNDTGFRRKPGREVGIRCFFFCRRPPWWLDIIFKKNASPLVCYIFFPSPPTPGLVGKIFVSPGGRLSRTFTVTQPVLRDRSALS